MGYKMTIEDGVDFSTTLINKTTISKANFRVFGNPYEFVLAKPTVEGRTHWKNNAFDFQEFDFE